MTIIADTCMHAVMENEKRCTFTWFRDNFVIGVRERIIRRRSRILLLVSLDVSLYFLCIELK